MIGALGQTRTGTPKRARILSPLCLPISPRGHSVFFVVIVNILIHKCFEEVKIIYFPSLRTSLVQVLPYFIGHYSITFFNVAILASTSFSAL